MSLLASGDKSSPEDNGGSSRRKRFFGRIFRKAKGGDETANDDADARDTDSDGDDFSLPDAGPGDEEDPDLRSEEQQLVLGEDEDLSDDTTLHGSEDPVTGESLVKDDEDEETVPADDIPLELPDPLTRGSEPYFSADGEGTSRQVDNAGVGEIQDRLKIDQANRSAPKKKFWLFRFLSRSRQPAPLEPKDDSIAERRTSELVVKFPDSSRSSDTPSDGGKKPKASLLVRAIRTVTILLAILVFSPLVTDEIEARFSPPATVSRLDHESPQSDLREREPIESGVESQEAIEEALKETLESPPSKAIKLMPLNEKTKVALGFVTDVVKEVGPSVVRVDTETHLRDQSDSPQPPGYIQQGQGSGLIFSDKGFILTNAHVVEDATKVTVTLTDGRVFSCQVMGSDEIVDIAVLKIIGGDVANLPVANLGDSDKLSVGKIVIAVGSPGGLDNTVTMGIVSGLERSSTMVGIPHKKVDYIQTDAAINPGNSGGPLIDVESGQVIGINAAIRAHMEGTSFAIPINRVRDIMTDLAEGREIHHGYLGLGLATCTPDWAKQNNADAARDGSPPIPEVYGAIVHKVFPRTPAENGGLKENDIILSIGEQKVKSAEDARRLIDLAPVGKDMPIKVLRGQREVVLTVKPVDLAGRLREMRKERQRQMRQEQLRYQELGPFRNIVQ